jgi:hypothetical protein
VRTQPCDLGIRQGRMRKAVQFVEAANTIRDFADEHSDIADAYVTLCVHAGIAASDVLEGGLHPYARVAGGVQESR